MWEFTNSIGLVHLQAKLIKTVAFVCFVWLTLLSCLPASGQSAQSAGSPTTLKECRDNGLAYFPAGTFKKPDGSPDEDWTDTWAWYLRERGEPPLHNSNENSQAQSYRLLIMGFPAAKTWIFRLQIDKDGTGRLFTKIAAFNGTNFLMNRNDAVSAADVNGFLKCVERAEFWQLPTRENPEPEMPDGSYWLLEGARQNEYHIVYRRSPDLNPGPFMDVGRFLAKGLAELPDSLIPVPRENPSEPKGCDARN